jgi:drug/metabolite transporter superfamily protein YnfA
MITLYCLFSLLILVTVTGGVYFAWPEWRAAVHGHWQRRGYIHLVVQAVALILFSTGLAGFIFGLAYGHH